MDYINTANNIIEDLISKNKVFSLKLFLKYETIQIETLDGIVINIKSAEFADLNLLNNIGDMVEYI